MGASSNWKFKRHPPPPPPPPGAPRTTESKVGPLDIALVNPPWTGGGHAAGPSIKSVCFILDVSGSMAGTRMKRTKENMLKVYDTYIGQADDVCYIEFNTQVNVKVPMSQNSDVHRRAMESARAGGGTNFYDAMLAGITQIEQGSQPNRKKYIIALTDGANGRSQYTPDDVVRQFMRHDDITPFIIGAGGDIPDYDVSVMQRMAGEQPKVPSIGGMYVSAKETDELEAAFESVAQAMNDAEMETL